MFIYISHWYSDIFLGANPPSPFVIIRLQPLRNCSSGLIITCITRAKYITVFSLILGLRWFFLPQILNSSVHMTILWIFSQFSKLQNSTQWTFQSDIRQSFNITTYPRQQKNKFTLHQSMNKSNNIRFDTIERFSIQKHFDSNKTTLT